MIYLVPVGILLTTDNQKALQPCTQEQYSYKVHADYLIHNSWSKSALGQWKANTAPGTMSGVVSSSLLVCKETKCLWRYIRLNVVLFSSWNRATNVTTLVTLYAPDPFLTSIPIWYSLGHNTIVTWQAVTWLTCLVYLVLSWQRDAVRPHLLSYGNH